MGAGHVGRGDSRCLAQECRGPHRNHDHCYVRYGSPGWVAPFTQVTVAAFASPTYPNYVPAGLWGGGNYWMGAGYVARGDSCWMTRVCGGSIRQHDRCYIRHGQ